MTKVEFNELTKGEKAVLLLKSGETLSKRSEPDFDVILYLLNDFFAELWYYKNSCKIVKAEVIENDMILINYPDLIIVPQISDRLLESKM